MKRISTYGMLSFELHVKLLAGLALTVPLIILVTQSVARIGFYFTGYLPNWVKALNRDVLEGYESKEYVSVVKINHTDSDIAHELLWTIASYLYLLSEIFVAAFLWKSAREQSVPKLKIWILICGTVTGAGILLLDQFRTFGILEVGFVVVYTKVSLMYSIYTFVVVIFLIIKIKSGVTT